MYALEAGTVKALNLYPRSILPGVHTRADKEAYELYAQRNRFHNDGIPVSEDF